MSTTIDQNVVEMRFDNSHFEQNVAKSMSTLDKFKEKLSFTGATKGIEEIDGAVKKIDMTSLGDGIESVRVKFSALDIVGVTALTNITNSAINAGKQLVSSLSVDQLTAGWDKYEKKTSSVQTIMNATGLSVEEVNEYLNQLMWFSDETSYSFSDMTAGLATMVSTGGDIKKLIPLITGVANATAYAGKGAAEFSRVLQYGVNQAYSLGYMQVMDWKTLEGATVNSKQLMESLIAAGEALGKIEEGAINTQNFRTSLADKWLDTEVMEAGFGRFSELSSAAYDAVAAGDYDTASEAMEALADQYDEISVKAFESAQKAKSFTEAIDATKDAVSSGWMKTYEIIFGSYDKATELWTKLTNALWTVFAAGAEVRNWILEVALNFSDPWKDISDKITGVTEKLKYAEDVVTHFQDVVNSVWMGDYKNADTGRYDLLTEAGYDYRVVQDLVNKGYQYELTVEDIAASHEKFGLTLETTTEEVEEMVDIFNDLSDEKFKDLGLTEDEIVIYKALWKEAKRTGKSIGEIAEEMSTNDGRTMLFEAINNLGVAMMDLAGIAKDAFAKIFDPWTKGDWVIKIWNAIDAFKKFTDSIQLFRREFDEETGELISEELTETGEKISRIFEGIYAAVDMVITILKGPATLVFETFNAVLSALGTTALDVFAGIGDILVGMRDVVNKVVEDITKFITDNVSKWVSDVKDSEFIKNVSVWFEDAATAIQNAVSNMSSSISSFETTAIGSGLVSFWEFLTGIGSTVANSEIFGTIVDGVIFAFEKLKEFFSGFKLPEFSLDSITSWFQNFVKIEDYAAESGISGVGGVMSGLGKFIKEDNVGWNWQLFKESLIQGFADFWIQAGDFITEGFRIAGEVFAAIKDFIFETQEVKLDDILKLAERLMALYLPFTILRTINNLVSPLDNLTDALDNLSTSLKWRAVAEMFKGMAIALGVLTVCLVILAGIEDRDNLVGSAIILGSLLVAMGVIVAALGFFSGKLDGGIDILSSAASLLLIVMAIAVMVTTLKAIDKLKLENIGKTFLTLAGILAMLSMGVWVVSKAGGSSFRSIAAILTLMTALSMVLSIIEQYDQFDWTGKTKAIERMMNMLVGLAVAIRIASGGTKAGASSTGAALLLMSMVVSLYILCDAIQRFANVPDEQMKKGGAAVLALMAVMTIMIMAMGLVNKNLPVLQKGERMANNFTGLAVALLAIVAAVWLLSMMTDEDMTQGIKGVTQIMLAMSVMLGVLGATCSNLKMGSVLALVVLIGVLVVGLMHVLRQMETLPIENMMGSVTALGAMLLAIAIAMVSISRVNAKGTDLVKWVVAMGVLTGIVYLLGMVLTSMKDISPASAISNAVGLAILLGTMCVVLKILNSTDMTGNSWGNLGKIGATFIALWILVGLLALVLTTMAKANVANGIQDATALGVLLIALAGAMWIISKSNMKAEGLGPALIAMAALTVFLFALQYVLRKLDGIDPLGAMGNAVALGILLNAMASAIWIISNSKNMDFKKMTNLNNVLLGLTVVLAIAAVLLAMMDGIDPAGAIANATALGILLNTMASALLVTSFAKTFANSVGTTVHTLLSLSVIMGILALVLGLMNAPDITNAVTNAIALGILLNAMAASMLILSYTTFVDGDAITGMFTLVVVVGLLALVLSAMNAMSCNQALNNALALSTLLLSMAVVYAILSVTSLIAGSATKGVIALLGVVALLGVAVVAIWKFMDSIPENDITRMKTQVEAFMDLIGLVATGIGEMIGGFVVGVISGFTEGLVKIGEDLKLFAQEMAEINPDAATGVKAICDALGALIGATFWNGVNDLLFGENSLSTFGEAVAEFAVSMKEASISLKDLTDDDVANIKRGAEAGTALAELETCIPRTGGWWQDVAGEHDIADFGKRIVTFAGCLIDYSNKVSGEAIDSEAIVASATAGKSLAELEGAVPAQGGEWQKWAGKQDIADFGARIVQFAECLIKYNDTIAESTFDAEAIKASAEAGKTLAELEGAIPAKDGWWQDIAGTQDIAAFGSSLYEFGKGLVDFSGYAAMLDTSAIGSIQLSGLVMDEIKKVVEKVPTSGGWGDVVFGTNDGQHFGTGLITLANGIKDFVAVADEMYAKTNLNSISNLGSVLDKIEEALDHMPSRDDMNGVDMLKTSVNNLAGVATTLNRLTTSNYSYSGLSSLNTAVRTVSNISTGFEMDDIEDAFDDLKSAADNAHKVGEYLNKLSGYKYDGVISLVAAISMLSAAKVSEVAEAFNVDISEIKTSVQSVVDAIHTGLLDGVKDVSTATTTLANTVLLNLTSAKVINAMEDAGKGLISDFVEGMLHKEDLAEGVGEEIGSKAVSGANTAYINMRAAGSYLGSGLVLGLNFMYTSVYNAGYALGQAAVQGEKDGQQSNSPSKLTYKAGKWLGEGLIGGMEAMSDKVYDSGHELGDGAAKSMTDTVARIANLISDDIDVQPTIRPIIDLSDVKTGVDAIGSMFGNTSMGITANTSAINSMISAASQNRGNDSVVAKLNELNKKLDNLGNTTYQINGVTYDDGSNIATAVQTITRAALRERRM